MEPKTIKTIFSFWGMFLISECLCRLWNVICIVISPFDCVIKIYSSRTIHNSPHAINNNIHSVKVFFISFYNSGSTCRNIMVFNACVYLYGADIFSYELACRLLSGHVHCFYSYLMLYPDAHYYRKNTNKECISANYFISNRF